MPCWRLLINTKWMRGRQRGRQGEAGDAWQRGRGRGVGSKAGITSQAHTGGEGGREEGKGRALPLRCKHSTLPWTSACLHTHTAP